MSQNNSKNKLQELLAKQDICPPTYNTFPTESGFVSEVFVWGDMYRGQPSTTKKGAEKNAAEVALEFIHKDDIESQIKPKTLGKKPKIKLAKSIDVYCGTPGDPSYLVLIDLENIQKVDIEFPEDVLVFGFISHISHLYGNIDKYRSKMFVEVAHSSVKDASDFLMALVLGRELDRGANGFLNMIYIVTKDHFGGALVDIVKHRENTNIKHITRLKDLVFD